METVRANGNMEVGFAKLQGKDFEYYMQTYSIVLGRNSKKSNVDVDLSSLGGGMYISRHHACIFYDFKQRHFALEVLSKNGCLIKGVLYLPGTPPVKLNSQDLLQIGDKEFYFLLPMKSILGGSIGTRHQPMVVAPSSVVPPRHYNYYLIVPPSAVGVDSMGVKKGMGDYYEDHDDVVGSSGKKNRRDDYEGYGLDGGVGSGCKALLPGALG